MIIFFLMVIIEKRCFNVCRVHMHVSLRGDGKDFAQGAELDNG
jgi:hypothetical protein